MKKIILIGSIIPIVVYLIFAIVVVGLVGIDNFELLKPNERIATIALSIYSQPILGILANVLAFVTMFTSFLALSIILLDMYELDFKVPKYWAMLLTFSVPFAVVLLNFTSFISLLGIVGTFTGGVEGIIIILMYWKAKKLGDRKPEFSLGKSWILGSLFISMFVFGTIYFFFQALK